MAGLVPAIPTRLQRPATFGIRPSMTTRKSIIPRAKRELVRLTPGHTPRYRVTDCAVLIDKAPANEADNPFATFSEWSNEADERAYGDL